MQGWKLIQIRQGLGCPPTANFETPQPYAVFTSSSKVFEQETAEYERHSISVYLSHDSEFTRLRAKSDQEEQCERWQVWMGYKCLWACPSHQTSPRCALSICLWHPVTMPATMVDEETNLVFHWMTDPWRHDQASRLRHHPASTCWKMLKGDSMWDSESVCRIVLLLPLMSFVCKLIFCGYSCHSFPANHRIDDKGGFTGQILIHWKACMITADYNCYSRRVLMDLCWGHQYTKADWSIWSAAFGTKASTREATEERFCSKQTTGSTNSCADLKGRMPFTGSWAGVRMKWSNSFHSTRLCKFKGDLFKHQISHPTSSSQGFTGVWRHFPNTFRFCFPHFLEKRSSSSRVQACVNLLLRIYCCFLPP